MDVYLNMENLTELVETLSKTEYENSLDSMPLARTKSFLNFLTIDSITNLTNRFFGNDNGNTNSGIEVFDAEIVKTVFTTPFLSNSNFEHQIENRIRIVLESEQARWFVDKKVFHQSIKKLN